MDDLAAVETLADWSAWVPWSEAAMTASLRPGVYMARKGADGAVVYVGMAGERRGRGVRGRLTVYRRGKGAVSGLGEAAMDRALADPDWLRARLTDLEQGHPQRTSEWATAALERVDLHVRWAERDDRAKALALEAAVLAALVTSDLWNRRR
jgi:hypothetical protein